MLKILKENKKQVFNLLLLFLFFYLLVMSYGASKYKPESVSELLNFTVWLNDWPKWLDLPLMNWINDWFKEFNEKYGIIFEVINNFLLGMVLGLKKILVKAPWPVVILLVTALAYFSSGKKIGTTVFVFFCTFFIGFLHPRFWDKADRKSTRLNSSH